MYGYIARVLRNVSLKHLRPIGSLAKAKPNSSEKWDVCASVLIERVPIVTKSLNSVEREFQELLWRIELEHSLKADHELQHDRDKKQAELSKTGGKLEMDADESSSKQTSQDREDAFLEEFNKFSPAPRQTQDDALNALTSTNRCLEETLYLLVEQPVGAEKILLLPQGIRHEGETMRQTAERVIRETCGTDLSVQLYGNAPCGFYKYKHPIAERDTTVGVRMFFYRAIWNQGNVHRSTRFEWLPKSGIVEKLPHKYKDSIRTLLF